MSGRSARSGFAAADIAVMALVAAMIVVGKSLLRMPVSVPGHAGVLWIAALVIGRGVVRRPGAATLMAFVGGLLVALIQPSDAGLVFGVAKYVLPGLVLDLLVPVLGRLDRVLPAVVAGAAAHAAKLAVDVVQGLVAGLPTTVLVAGLTLDSIFHIAFGALGGLLGALVLRALMRARIPQLRDLPATEEAST
jgi:hypothetical protein